MSTITRSVPSPLGDLLLVGDGENVHGLYHPDHRPSPRLEGVVEDGGAYADVVQQLAEWFTGQRTTFDLGLGSPHGTEFQRRVWDVLGSIPFGQTATYGEVAARAGRPGSARAVGHAVARNPLSIIVPCHRVVGTGGSLTGYAGGVDRKRLLLDHERAVMARSAQRAG